MRCVVNVRIDADATVLPDRAAMRSKGVLSRMMLTMGRELLASTWATWRQFVTSRRAVRRSLGRLFQRTCKGIFHVVVAYHRPAPPLLSC